MSKPVMTGNGVLRNRLPFDPEWASNTTRCRHATGSADLTRDAVPSRK
jgi:hypothetical protein